MESRRWAQDALDSPGLPDLITPAATGQYKWGSKCLSRMAQFNQQGKDEPEV